MTKYVITLELEMDPNETVDGTRINNPDRWNYNALLSAGGFHVAASVAKAYEACCGDFVEWVTTDPDDRYPSGDFRPSWHEEGCVHFVSIEDDEFGDEELLNTVFGNVLGQLDGLTVRAESEVK